MTVLKNPSRLISWCLFLSYTVFLYILFTLPPDKIPEAVVETPDKPLHLLVFFLLALLAFRAFSLARPPLFQRHAEAKATGFSAFYGVFLEGVQLGVPGREASWEDGMADLVGIALAASVFLISHLTSTSRLTPSR